MSITSSICYKEATTQYEALRETFRYMSENKSRIQDFFKENKFQIAVFSGCGSSFEISRSSAFSAALRFEQKSYALASGDIMLNFGDYSGVLNDSALFFVTRSGSTSEVLKAMDKVKDNYGSKIISIVCKLDSQAAAKSDLVLEIPWAFDESVCQTRTVSNLYAANLLLISYICGDTKLEEYVGHAIEAGGEYIAKWEGPIRDTASFDWEFAVMLADGELAGIASEGSLAFKEICCIKSNHHNVLDVRHGPMVGINNKTLVIAAFSSNDDKYQRDLISDIIKNRGARVIVYSPEEIAPIEGVSLHVTSSQPLGAAAGIPFIFIPQIAALTRADALNVNPDKPDQLTAWIKL
ncbi:MAG: SIS domain-containing protein [Oscillospiraceae bacterium]|nr:SIS domain-containing protein [Oscillospiraceae bacterium]